MSANIEEHEPCLAARLGGPDRPPFLCELPKGHDGEHVVRNSLGNEVWRWSTVTPCSFTLVPDADGRVRCVRPAGHADLHMSVWYSGNVGHWRYQWTPESSAL